RNRVTVAGGPHNRRGARRAQASATAHEASGTAPASTWHIAWGSSQCCDGVTFARRLGSLDTGGAVVGIDRTAYDSQQLGVLDDLLAASARGPDVRDLFQHLCAVGPRLVPYDEAQLVVSSGRLAARRYACTHDGGFEQTDATAVETI